MNKTFNTLHNVAALTAVVVTLCFLCNCGDHDHDHNHEHETQESEHHEGHHHGHDDIILEPDKADAAGIKTESASRGTFHDIIVTSGKLLAASCDETNICATTNGIIHHAQHISEGMEVRQGTVLYYISSKTLQDGDNAKRSEIAYLAAKQEYERAKPLIEEKIISEKDFNIIKAEYEKAELTFNALNGNNTAKGISIKAPVSGYLKECLVKDGDYVEIGSPLITITRNQHLYLRAEVPVRYYSQISNIKSAKFKTQYSDEVFDLDKMNGTFLSSGKATVSSASYIPVTFQLDNHGSIIPGAFAEVFLIAGERHDVLTVPSTAITEEQGLFYIYVKEDEHTYHKKEVSLGASDGQSVEICSGLECGELVVTRGAISVKLAGASKAIPGHTHNH